MSCTGHEHASRPSESDAELRVVDVLRRVTSELLREDPLSPEQRRLLASIRDCRTPALGGEVLVCPQCSFEKEVFHSCRNRHCPNCQAQAQDAWIAARADSMLPVPHFHVVFTLPAQLRGLCKAYPAPMYNLLLRSCGDVLIKLGNDSLGAQLGVTVVLHTWTRDLQYHVHAHCIVSAGGWDPTSATLPTTAEPMSHSVPTEAPPEVSTGHSVPTEAAPDNEPLPAWRERCCPSCRVKLLVRAQIPRPPPPLERPP